MAFTNLSELNTQSRILVVKLITELGILKEEIQDLDFGKAAGLVNVKSYYEQLIGVNERLGDWLRQASSLRGVVLAALVGIEKSEDRVGAKLELENDNEGWLIDIGNL